MLLDAYVRHYTVAAFANGLLDEFVIKGFYLSMVRKIYNISNTFPNSLVFTQYPTTTLFDSMNKWRED